MRDRKFLRDKYIRPWHTACPCKSPLQTDKQITQLENSWHVNGFPARRLTSWYGDLD